MTEAVFFYQLFILVSVVGIAIVVGPKWMVGVAVAWAIWSLVMVFTSWLFILQFVTIGAALFAGFAIHESKRYSAVQSFARKGLLGLGILAVISIAAGQYFENTQQRDFVAPVERSALGSPTIGTRPNRVLEIAADPRMAEPAPQEKPEPGKIFVCKEKRGGQAHVTYQDFPCASTR